MKKVKIQLEEKLSYIRDIDLHIPDEMTEKQLERILYNAERNSEGVSDFVFLLQKEDGINVGIFDEDMDYPSRQDVELYEYVWDGE